MNNNDPIVVTGIARTPMGGFQGVLKEISAPELGSFAIRAALERCEVPAEVIDEVLMGCVLPAGMGRLQQDRPHLVQEFQMLQAAQLSTRCVVPV